VTVEPGLAGRVDARLVDAAVSALSLARKAGTVIGGFTKVESALAHEHVVGVIHATEAAADGVARVAAAMRRHAYSMPPVIRCFTGAELDLAFGRSNVIHAALLAGPASNNVLARIQDLVRFRGNEGGPDGGSRSTSALPDLNEASVGP
jgi:hypothetical protein